MKNKWQQIGKYLGFDHFHRLWQIKSLRLSLFGILFIPVMYSFIYLHAFYDPYANMKYFPVAIVNEDQGAVKNQEPIHIGNDLVKKLRENSKLKWEFVSREEMKRGFKEGKYYVGIVIPKNFSAFAVTVDSPKPLKGVLEYYTDEGNNYLSGRMGESIIRNIENDLERELTQAFVDRIFAEMKKSTKDLEKAANGAKELADGTQKAKNGSKDLANGLDQAKNASEQLAEGNRKLKEGLGELAPNMDKVAQGIDSILSEVLKIQKVAHEINDVIQKWTKQPLPQPPQVPSPVPGADHAKDKIQNAKDQVRNVKKQYQKLLQEKPELQNDPTAQSLSRVIDQAVQYNDLASKELGKIQVPSAAVGTSGQAQSTQDILDKISQISNAKVAEIDAKVKEVKKLSQGAKQLAAGADQLYEGSKQVYEGQRKLNKGMDQLYSGATELNDGLKRINDGQHELADGLNDGVNKANEKLKGTDEKAKTIADPVHVDEKKQHPVPNYATGFAPYFISLSMWVGAMLLFTVLDLEKASHQLEDRPLSIWVIGLIGVAQALISIFVLTWGLDIEAKLPVWLYVFTIAISFTFIAINQMLAEILGNVGRFLAILILMLQLTSTGGTYPIELIPDFYQALHPYLPMTYSIHGLRMIISNGDVHAMLKDLNILLSCFMAAFTVTRVYKMWMKPKIKTYLLKRLQNA
ncbi:YhgE/Pip domain-containing protein [Thermoflavimicrobium dichotomicum]|uniref:Putative membrane protein n=1 Tax=Thermoflavimicrobium dichotomicum TaxID=46223 RepID=A0A1I3KJT3_9BACL|nr:YhgE/Pip domain-containing protein [Thermoflavimicrobium dichotomicum]SFI72455.1 putative membrane protein [Thermoflavimicrobium dichotomicum]